MTSISSDTTALLIDGRYRAVRTLGQGGGGEVILAEDTQLDNSLLALKLLYPHLLFSDASFARFRTETRVTMQLSHPNILPTFGMGRTESNVIYLKMDFNDGPSLDKIIQKHPCGCSIELVLAALRSIALGLQYAHERGIIHRDLKPANILLSSAHSFRIADFGMAYMIRAESKLTRKGEILGTPHYMAPEVLRGDLPDIRSDVYAFGVLGYELLTGKLPYGGDSFWELAEQICSTPPLSTREIRPDAPEWLHETIFRCLKKEKYLRYSSLLEVLEALQTDAILPHEELLDTSLINITVEAAQSEQETSVSRTLIFAQQYLRSIHTFILRLGLYLLLPILPPFLNEDAQGKYSIMVLGIEKIFDTKIPLLRTIFNTPPNFQWPDSAFRAEHGKLLDTYVLLGYPLNVYSETGRGYPIHGAISFQNDTLLTAILDNGGKVDVQDIQGRTPLYYAIEIESPFGIQKVLEYHPNPNIQTLEGRSPLHLAARRGAQELLLKLLQLRGNPNLPDKNGNTPLHEATLSGNPGIAQILISHGANANQKNNSGRSARDILRTLLPESLRREMEKSFQAKDAIS